MTTVNIAFSGGLESTYLLQLALEKGFTVNLCMINVGGTMESRLGELIAMERIIKFFKMVGDEERAYLPKAKWTLPGRINDVMHYAGCPFVSRQESNKSLATFDVTQQFGVILGMLAIRREYLDDYMPSTWIGWIKEDAAEFSFNEMDHSEKDYQDLLNLPELIGPLSNADNLGIKFRAPLWEMSKTEIYGKLLDALKPMLIPNGRSHVDHANNKVEHFPHQSKLEEWKDAGLPHKGPYIFQITEPSWIVRYITGTLLPADVEQPDTFECRKFLQTVAPFFAKGRTIIRPKDVPALRKEVIGMTADLIIAAKEIPKLISE